MQQSLYQQNRNYMLMMGATIFVSITAAVIVSTLVIMSLMRGEIASALTSTVNTSAPATAQTAAACGVPASEATDSTAAAEVAMVNPTSTAAAPLYVSKYVPLAATHSFNNTSTTTMNTTNNVTNTEVKTIIKDSFNKDSYNDNSKFSHNTVNKNSNNVTVVKDNTVNVASNNTTAINSGNTATTNTTTNTTTNVVTNSNNTSNVASNNTTTTNTTVENHLLSDNTVVVVPAV